LEKKLALNTQRTGYVYLPSVGISGFLVWGNYFKKGKFSATQRTFNSNTKLKKFPRNTRKTLEYHFIESTPKRLFGLPVRPPVWSGAGGKPGLFRILTPMLKQ